MIWQYRLMGFFAFLLLTSVSHAGAVPPLVLAAAITAGGALIGGGIQAFSAERAIDSQRKESRRTEQLQLDLYGQNFREAKRQFNLELLQRKSEAKQSTKAKQSDNAMAMSNRMISAFNENPRVAQSFYEIADRRRT